MKQDLQTTDILGVSITISSETRILEYITTSLQKKDSKVFVVTPNPEILVYASKHPTYRALLNQAQVALPDGIGVVKAGMFLGKDINRRIAGVDFVKKLCENVSKSPVSIGFLGGRHQVAEVAANCLREKYREINITVIGEEWNSASLEAKIKSPKLQAKTRNYVKYKQAVFEDFPKVDILFVAFGHPKQEEWIYENLEYLPATVVMGVGGSFDFLSGRVSRAPTWIQDLGVEWLYRLIQEPWRLKRQLALIKFILLVLKEKFSSKS